MTLYLDDQFLLHTQQNEAETLVSWDDTEDFFAGKCDAFIEGYRVVPEGETWTREDGRPFSGLTITPAINPAILQEAQIKADEDTIAALDAAVVDLTYQNILLEMGV